MHFPVHAKLSGFRRIFLVPDFMVTAYWDQLINWYDTIWQFLCTCVLQASEKMKFSRLEYSKKDS